MKALYIEQFGLDHLVLAEVPQPMAGPQQVLVQVRAASLNYLDLLVISGGFNPGLPLPHVPLSDVAGRVVAVGPGVTALAVGDDVVSTFIPQWRGGTPTAADVAVAARPGLGVPGYLAEYVAVPAAALVRSPANLTPLEAATLPIAGLTAWNALRYVQLEAGQTVLLHGTGGVSLFALQFAKARGARVIITSKDDAKLARAAELGADHTLNYRTQPDWPTHVLDLTAGQGVDAVVETVGGDNLNQSLRALKIKGRIAIMGVLNGVTTRVDTLTLLGKQATLVGMEVGSTEDFEAMNRAIETHDLHPVVDQVFPVAQLREALLALQAGRHFGKIGLTF
ncbi:zinc-dependent alcohol dehydrogenase family protein [Hymenobacter terrenus]|uniref:zinc-dependent alcohol dehydrogenase family protein n=1 Tax=Hymenobacter terrenus TaxID=1629124 RepID=UPI00061910A3|nr:NAD(P)-dependent alcohol dehydrogenase [Hymenobacter terrenus]